MEQSGAQQLFNDLANRLIRRILEADRRAEKDADIELALVSIIAERNAVSGQEMCAEHHVRCTPEYICPLCINELPVEEETANG